MKKYRRQNAIVLSLLLILLLLPMNAFAAGSIDLSRDASLTISYQDGNTPLTGAQFDLYLVATVDECGELTTTKDFALFNVNIRGSNDEAWKTLASTLEGYVLRDGLKPADSGITDKNGLAAFPTSGKTLTKGLYLVLGSRLTQNGHRYDPAPFMVLLPVQDKESNTWNYNVTANAKYDSSIVSGDDTINRKVLKVWKDDGYEKERPKEVVVQLLRNGKIYDTVTLSADNSWRHTWTDLSDQYTWTVVEKELNGYTAEVTREGITYVITNTYDADAPVKPTPTSPSSPSGPAQKLPQTGQLWWPVPLLLCAGLLFVVIGLVRRRGMENEKK